jgi:hypothetical protein
MVIQVRLQTTFRLVKELPFCKRLTCPKAFREAGDQWQLIGPTCISRILIGEEFTGDEKTLKEYVII